MVVVRTCSFKILLMKRRSGLDHFGLFSVRNKINGKRPGDGKESLPLVVMALHLFFYLRSASRPIVAQNRRPVKRPRVHIASTLELCSDGIDYCASISWITPVDFPFPDFTEVLCIIVKMPF